MLHFRHSIGFYQFDCFASHTVQYQSKRTCDCELGPIQSSMLKITNCNFVIGCRCFFLFRVCLQRSQFAHNNVIDRICDENRSSLPSVLYTNLVHTSDTHAYSILFAIFACIIASRVLHRVFLCCCFGCCCCHKNRAHIQCFVHSIYQNDFVVVTVYS